MPPPSTLNSRWRGYDVLRVALGGLLLVTAGLKAHSLLTGYWTPNFFLSTPRMLVAAIEIEAVLGLLVLSGLMRRLAWALALIAYSCLAVASLYLAIDGQPDCGCLGGRVHASPWWIFGVDLAAVAALGIWRPPVGETHRLAAWPSNVLRVPLGAAVFLTLVIGIFLLVVEDPATALAQLRGELIIVDPAVSDMGEGVRGDTRTFAISLHNHSDRPVRIMGGTTTCECVATADLPVTILAQDSCTIRITTKFRGKAGRIENQFVLYSDDEKQGVVVCRFAGRVVDRTNP